MINQSIKRQRYREILILRIDRPGGMVNQMQGADSPVGGFFRTDDAEIPADIIKAGPTEPEGVGTCHPVFMMVAFITGNSGKYIQITAVGSRANFPEVSVVSPDIVQ